MADANPFERIPAPSPYQQALEIAGAMRPLPKFDPMGDFQRVQERPLGATIVEALTTGLMALGPGRGGSQPRVAPSAAQIYDTPGQWRTPRSETPAMGLTAANENTKQPRLTVVEPPTKAGGSPHPILENPTAAVMVRNALESGQNHSEIARNLNRIFEPERRITGSTVRSILRRNAFSRAVEAVRTDPAQSPSVGQSFPSRETLAAQNWLHKKGD